MKKDCYKSVSHCGVLLVFLLCSTIMSCNSGSNKGGVFSGMSDMFESELEPGIIEKAVQQYSLADSTSSPKVKSTHSELVALYQENKNSPIWLTGKKVSEKGKLAIASLEELRMDGLHPEKYQLAQLQKQLNNLPTSDDSLALFDVTLSQSMISAAYDLTFGVLVPKDVDKEWHSANDSVFSAKALLVVDNNNTVSDLLASFRPNNPRYALMRKEMAKWQKLQSDSAYLSQKALAATGDLRAALAVIQQEVVSAANDVDSNILKNYQYLNHLSTTGKLDEELIAVLNRTPETYMQQLRINMERMRWLPNTLDNEYLWVSIPQAEVDYYKGGSNLFHNRSIVGSVVNKTPTILKPLQNIVICPPWNLPHSIVLKDYGGRAPAKYEVYKGGKRVPNSMVNASNYRQFSLRQPAGPGAALGYVKFNLPNQWDIYLHDTPNRNLFGNKMRYLSHGCIRVKEPRELASIILEHKGIGLDSINTIIKTNRTTFINTEKIPVYISYLTVNADSTMQNLLYLNDPYKKDVALSNKLVSLDQ